MEKEIWKRVLGYENLYMISNLGRIKSLHFSAEKILNPSPNDNGYLHGAFHINKKQKRYKIHRLVAQAFIDNPKNKRCVNHINGIKTDNRIENLEWCTHSENMKHSYKIGLMKRSELAIQMSRKKCCKRLFETDKNKTFITEYASVVEASIKTGIRKESIARVARGERNHTHGRIFCYLNISDKNNNSLSSNILNLTSVCWNLPSKLKP